MTRFVQQPVFLTIFLSFYLATGLATPIQEETASSGAGDIVKTIQNLLINEKDKHRLTDPNNSSIDWDSVLGQAINILNCGQFFNSPNSHLQYSVDYSANKLKLFQECDRYYNTTQNKESLQVRCLYNKWIITNKINCQKITCPRLTPPAMGAVSTTENTFNTTAYFWCLYGYKINGTTDKIYCQENGQWDLPLPSCEMSYCRPLSPPLHGYISSTKEVAVNQTLRFFCQSEYTMIGGAVLKCQPDGRWNTSAPVCLKVCKVPDIAKEIHLRVLPSFEPLNDKANINPGTRVVYTCRPGFTSSGISTCVGGKWKPPIICTKTCTVSKIDNGGFILSKGTQRVDYYCLSGYELVGQSTLVCTPENTWDHEAPVCIKLSLCTLSKNPLIISYRNKTTYKEIPDGTTINNGMQVYHICNEENANNKFGITKCIDGKIDLSPVCGDKRFKTNDQNILMAFDEGAYSWKWLCSDSNYDCSSFGFSRTSTQTCESCYYLDSTVYKEQSIIRLTSNYRSYHYYDDEDCITCY